MSAADMVAYAWYLSPLVVSLLFITVAFGIGIGLGKLFTLRIEHKIGRHL